LRAFVKRSSSHLKAYQLQVVTRLAVYHSYQARFDHWIATHILAFTRSLDLKLDAFLREILSTIAGFDIFELPHEGTPLPRFTEERVAKSKRHTRWRAAVPPLKDLACHSPGVQELAAPRSR